ncbi:MAG: PDZ domain-containing protein [Smithella sp.]|nr:PDZ domain-containing protein [Smithella sp.]
MVKSMWDKATQLIKELPDRFRNTGSLSEMNITALRPLFIILAITLLSYLTVDLFYKLISFPLTGKARIVSSQAASPLTVENKKTGAIEDYGLIVERNLFQTTLKPVQDKDTEGSPFGPEQKTVNVDLKGTVACNDSFGYIFVEEQGSKKQKLYKLGDKIGSAKLIKISRNTATLSSGGGEITLKVKATIEGQLLPEPSARNLKLSRDSVNRNLANLNEIMKQAIVRPFMNKGVQEGFIISNIVPDSLYEKMGLKNGDIVVDVNNKKLRGADDLLQAVNLMQSGANISLNIKRAGKQETINYTFE